MASIRNREWVTPMGEQKSAWVVDYTDQHGKRHIKTFRLKKDAETWQAETVVDIRRGIHSPESTSITLMDAGEMWLRHGEIGGDGSDPLERSTIQQRRQHLELHIRPFFGNEKLARITAQSVKQFVRWMLENGRSREMVRMVLTNLKTLISYAQAEGIVAHNVAREVKFRRSDRDNKEIELPSKEDIRRLIYTVRGRWRPIIVTAIFTGLRASELRGLTWDNVDFDEQTIRVTQRADRWRTIGNPKSKAARRTIPLAPIVLNTLKEWKLACPLGDLGLVFPNGRGNVEYQSHIYRRGFVPLMAECGLVDERGVPLFTFHTLRHIAASLIIEQGWQPKRVQAVMGHASMAMTFDRYGHLFPTPEDDKRSMREIQARLLG